MTSVLEQTTERTVSNDLAYGLIKENIIINNLRMFFPNYTNIMNTKQRHNNQFCSWDYECDDGNRFELKSRRLNSNAYSSALLSVHKADKNCIKKQYFVFNYTDRVLYIEYNQALFDTFDIRVVRDYRIDRKGKEERCFEIPISCMKELNN
jgi:hypothetical protein